MLATLAKIRFALTTLTNNFHVGNFDNFLKVFVKLEHVSLKVGFTLTSIGELLQKVGKFLVSFVFEELFARIPILK